MDNETIDSNETSSETQTKQVVQGTVNAEASEVVVQPTFANSQPFYRRKPVLIGAAGLLVVAVVASGVFAFNANKSKQSTDQSSSASRSHTLGAIATVIDGEVQHTTDGVNWHAITADETIEQGSTIRTAANGRVVITLDDGSAIRANSTSTLKLTSLDSKDIKIDNLGGEVYTRVVKSDRVFGVSVGDETYVALGTAYKTVNRDGAQGVEVYQSEVSVKKASQKVAEGKRFYQANAVAELDKKVTDIPLDQLLKDDFLRWNLDLDKKTKEFKDKLGYLVTLEKTPAPASAPAPAPQPTTNTGISLSGSKSEKGVNLAWKVSGLAVGKGFKIVKSLSVNPTYGKDSATFVDAATRSYSLTIKDGKTYHFRVCIYNGESCTNYSNNITVTAPLYQVAEPTGSVSLQFAASAGQNNLKWVMSGTAPHGYKLVWSLSPSPTYPGSDKVFYDGNATAGSIGTSAAGTYYARLCVLTSHAECFTYSNELTVSIP